MASQASIDQAWNKGNPIRGKNPDVWRKDPYGNTIRKASYGTFGNFGWELDHKKPSSRGGSDHSRNIQPVHWRENRRKGNQYPYKGK